MECIKKLHDKLDQVDKVSLKLVKFANLVMQIFVCSFRRIVSDISLILHFCCILATANMLSPVSDKLIIR